MLAKMRNMGEACTPANRSLVHAGVADVFADKLAERMGALLVGCGPGHFSPPTVLAGVAPDARANDTEHGRSSSLHTRDLGAIRASERLEHGMVGANSGLVSDPAAPFGGVKASGFGHEAGVEGIEEYLETTYVQLPGS